MAPEKKDKKRKATASSVAVPSEQPLKKTKKSVSKAVKPVEATNDPVPKSAPAKLDGKPAREVKPRKRAADFLSDDEDVQEKTEKVKKAKAEPKGKKEKLLSKPDLKETELASNSEDESASEDDQTAALIRGFESSDDEEDPSGDEGFEPGQEVPKIPDSKQIKRKLRKMKKREEEPEEPGVVCISRIPHGFYEHEMRAYFSQFGTITRLRLSRNRTTGRSKHYAFIEFAHTSVARIVADTMNNYLMFGHILKCKVIPNEQIHPRLWEGANRRFKKMPWNKIEQRRLDAGRSREKWSKAIEKEEKKRQIKAEKMKALGYEMEIPALKSVDEVPVREDRMQIDVETEEPKVLEAPAEAAKKTDWKAEEAPKEVNKKKKKQDKKDSAAISEKKAPVEEKKPKEKAKSIAAPEKKSALEGSPAVKDKKKAKKAKKAKA